ncbi:MAG: hypothetical protein PHV48_02055 [Candidatus Omnitrophica bacterium]|nr:hypothetical protein [Candidatus Omnitrophota bacterium]
MIRVILLMLVCLALSSCETLKNIRENEGLDKVGSFQLNPVQPDNYWYNGRSYEYNNYKIKVTAEPVRAKIQWNGKTIGTTPFVYRFSGVLDVDDRVVVRAIPIDENLPAQEAMLRIRKELPREIHFDLRKK